MDFSFFDTVCRFRHCSKFYKSLDYQGGIPYPLPLLPLGEGATML